MHTADVRAVLLVAIAAMVWPGALPAADFRAADAAATVLYDGPSQKAKPLAVFGRDYPLEVLVSVEGWLKIRDATGTLGWVEKKSVSERRMLMVRVPVADILAAADPNAPLVFRAEQNVLLQLDDSAPASTSPGWIAVRHRDGQAGFIRIQQVWGF